MMIKYFNNHRGFLSDYYLGSVFARDLTSRKKKTFTDREIDYAMGKIQRIWRQASSVCDNKQKTLEKFIRPLVRDVLGFHLGSGENSIYRLFFSAEAEEKGDKPILLCYCGDWDECFDSGRSMSNPMQLLTRSLSDQELKYGFLVSGERIRLIRAAGEGPKGSYLEVDLSGLVESERYDSFAAFLRLFSCRSFLPDDHGKILIEEIEKESRVHAEKISDDLKEAVFNAAEKLVSGLIKDAISKGIIASALEIDDGHLRLYRDAALTCLYRILFILYAESRDPRVEQHKIYRENYSAQGILDEIIQNPDYAWPENRSYFWSRLKALFKIYDKGLPRVSEWENIPPRGSNFFSDSTAEGSILKEATLSDRLIFEIMLSLGTSVPRHGIGRERISFRELDIESLGAVYEGLLEYDPKIISETAFEINVQGRTYCLNDNELQRLCQKKGLKLKGDLALLEGMKAQELISQQEAELEDQDEVEEEDKSDLENGDQENEEIPDEDSSTNSEYHEKAIEKGSSAKIIRKLSPGSFVFIPGPAKKGTGSYYTPRALVRDLIRHTLGPLIKDKNAKEIESLRILDPACGSAHFLVEAMRYLGQALHRSYVIELKGKAPEEFRSTTDQGWDDDWKASDEEARASNSEARAWCKRRIVEKCLFGVDLNPTAVELARVALWIESVAGDRPLTYFEHHIRCGNSLLGTWIDRFDIPPLPSLKRRGSGEIEKKRRKGLAESKGFYTSDGIKYQFNIYQDQVKKVITEAAELRTQINNISADDLLSEGIEPDSVEEQIFKEDLRQRSEKILSTLKLIFDLRSASIFLPEIWREFDLFSNLAALNPDELESYLQSKEWWPKFEEIRARERFFHWELEFPEVFLDEYKKGFDVVLGNPPWDKIKPDRKEFYGKYDVLIRAFKGKELDQRINELQKAIPSLKDGYAQYENIKKITANYLKKGGDFQYHDWLIDGKSSGGDPDLFKYFVEQAWKLVRNEGRVGFVVPSAIYNNEGCTGLRHLLLGECQIERFYSFENRKKIFPIDSRMKIISLVFKKTKAASSVFNAAFMRHDLEELEESSFWREPGQEPGKDFPFPSNVPWIVEMSKEQIEKTSPGTLAFLEYRNKKDQEILLKMHEVNNLLGDRGEGRWNIQFYTEFHMTNDADLWTEPKTSKLWNPYQILGPIPGTNDKAPYYERAAWPEIRARMAEKGFWPLYEGKHIDQFLVDTKPIERWVNLEAAEKKTGQLPDHGAKLVFRAIARNTDERTLIAAVLPEKSCFGHLCWGIHLREINPNIICSFLNTLIVDFSVRLRISLSIGPTHLLRLAMISRDSIDEIPVIETISVYDDKLTNIYLNLRYFQKLWQLNRTVAEAYGLSPDNFEYILSTFPVFARKRPEFFKFISERINEWKKESVPSPYISIYDKKRWVEASLVADKESQSKKNNKG